MNANDKLSPAREYLQKFVASDLKTSSTAHVELILDAKEDYRPKQVKIDFGDAADEWFDWLYTKLSIPEKLKSENLKVIGSIVVNFREYNYRKSPLQVPMDVIQAAEAGD